MSLYVCATHGITGPTSCCPQGSRVTYIGKSPEPVLTTTASPTKHSQPEPTSHTVDAISTFLKAQPTVER